MISSAIFERALEDFLSPLRSCFEDAEVTEILINGPTQIFVERAGVLSRRPQIQLEPQSLLGALRVVAQYVGRAFDEAHPILEARLPDGSRLEAILSPIAQTGPCVAIRRHRAALLTLDRLVELGALTERAAHFLAHLVCGKKNILVSGGTGSGKTSLLNGLVALVSEQERILVLEDSRELEFRQGHVVSLEARPADVRGRGEVPLFELFRATLRLRPDRIIMGELRGREALDLIQAMTSGHGGCLSTIHASSPADALRRLETLALLSGVELPLSALREQVVSAVDWIVQTDRLPGGRRGVTHITEIVTSDSSGKPVLRERFSRRRGGVLLEVNGGSDGEESGHAHEGALS